MATQGNTGTDDVTYNVISIIYHALQGADLYEQYISDAQQAGDQELADFFRQVRDENKQRAERGKQLLTRQLGQDQA